ncbi:glycosyl transferase [Leptolyngbya sp. PCC 7375]|nr:glycosyl transferase [Leptolyngbya sp. PCC 7375]
MILKKTTFSVITPSFQQGNFIERTICSVLDQDCKDIEYFVLDGGSTDKTVSVLKRYSRHLTWVSEPDDGQAHAVNKGLAMSTGEIIAWINSDDIYYPHAFEQVSLLFEANPDVAVVYGQADWIDQADNIIAPYPTRSWDYGQLTKECYLCQPAVFFRRSVAERLGGLDPSLQYCMDYELWLRYGQMIPFSYLPVNLAGSRIYPTNKTFGSRLAAHREANEMLCARLGHSTRHWIFEYSKLQLESDSKAQKTDLIFAFKLFVLAIKNCWSFNKRATAIVCLKVILDQLFRQHFWLRSQPKINIENVILDQHDQV